MSQTEFNDLLQINGISISAAVQSWEAQDDSCAAAADALAQQHEDAEPDISAVFNALQQSLVLTVERSWLAAGALRLLYEFVIQAGQHIERQQQELSQLRADIAEHRSAKEAKNGGA